MASISDQMLEQTKPLSLRKNFVWTFAGNSIYAASQWGILVVIAKLGTSEMVGQFSLGLAITAPIIIFFNLQLRSVQATDAQDKYQFADYFALRIITTSVAFIIIIGVALVGAHQAITLSVILFIALSKSFEALSDVCFGFLQRRERMDRIAQSLIIEGPLTLVGMSIVLLLTHNVVLVVATMAFIWGGQLFLYDLRNVWLLMRNRQEYTSNTLYPRFSLPVLRKLAFLALPLGFVAMLNSLGVNIPKLYIAYHLRESQLGIFSAISYITTALMILCNGLGQSAMPRLSSYFANGKPVEFRNLLLKLISIGLCFGLGGVLMASLFGKQILTLLYQPEYAKETQLFLELLIAACIAIVASFFNYALLATHSFKLQLYLFITMTLATLISNELLVPRIGLHGAVLSTIIVLCIQLLGSLLIIRYMFKNAVYSTKKQL